MPQPITLVRAYRWFLQIADKKEYAERRVPVTPADRTRDLYDELGTWAYAGLVTVIPPRTDGARALLMVMVPDLVFAQLDNVAPAQLLIRLDSAVLERWRVTSRLLPLDARHKLELTIPAAAAIVKRRIETEARYHRPLAPHLASPPPCTE